MIESLKQLRASAMSELSKVSDLASLDELVVKYFGRKQGQMTHVLRSLRDLDESKRKILGREANEVKIEIWRLIDEKRTQIKKSGTKELIDFTIDGSKPELGHVHPLTQTRLDMEKFFRSMGYAIMQGTDIENDYYTFETLNIPAEHPARDMWDTFYLKSQSSKSNAQKLLLRPHTSPMQVRAMERFKPPFSVIVPGHVFRHEATDSTHEHTFDQLEGFSVSENTSLADLKYTITELFKNLFGNKVELQFRPSYFPFTEPSIEVMMRAGNRWLEMLGAGMIHPKVFASAGYPKDKYSGFAFGIGISRVTMLKFGIPDVRMLYQNDSRFLNQF